MFTRRKLFTALTLTVLSIGAVAAEQESSIAESAKILVSKAFDDTQRDLSLGVTFDVLEATQAMEVKDTESVLMVAEITDDIEKAINPTDNNDV